MGMYTEVGFAAEVDEEAYRVFEEYQRASTLLGAAGTHPFFDMDRAEMIIGGHGGSYYFPGACRLTLEVDGHGAPLYSVSLRANLKNYEGEIQAFFDWITPHVKAGAGGNDYIGHHIYEEDEVPTLHYARIPAEVTL